ncbi:hypothetical protein AN958_03561 [Leucoagaricus sp. SymC.cos]|nr:hypothetical protein AN958_03561 [Leucoagaricus sp. SymC.cos]
MSSPLTLDRLPSEILEEILEDLEYDRDILDSLGLTCHALLTGTRPHRFPLINLHDQNFDDFIKLTHCVPWNTITPHVKRIILGNKMFPLIRCQLDGSVFGPDCNSLDLTGWAAQFSSLWMLDIRGAFWPSLPLHLTYALLHLRPDHLTVCLRDGVLPMDDLEQRILPMMRPQTLTISGRVWEEDFVPPLPTYIPESTPFYIHYMRVDSATQIKGFGDWLSSNHSPPSIVNLYIELPRTTEAGFKRDLLKLLPLISPTHLRLKLPSRINFPSTSKAVFEFPDGVFSGLETLQISSISNDIFSTSDTVSNEVGSQVSDVTATTSLLQQFSVISHHLKRIQLDSICTHTNLTYGRIPELLSTSFLSLELLRLTLRSGVATRKEHLDAWLRRDPFSSLREKGVEVRVEVVASDSIFLQW